MSSRAKAAAAGGAALLETLIALVLVMVALVGALRLQLSLLGTSAAVKAQDEAATLAQAKISELTAYYTYNGYLRLASGQSQVNGQLHRYRLSWQVNERAVPLYKRLRVQVQWPATEPLHSVQLETFCAARVRPRFTRFQLQP